MPAGATYEPIATTTLANDTTKIVTFNSISGSYTDLKLIVVVKGATGAASSQYTLKLNNDGGNNYSFTTMYGDGSTASTTGAANTTLYAIQTLGLSTTYPSMQIIDIFSYAGSTNKTVLAQSAEDYNGTGFVTRLVGLWRNTTAITRIDFDNGIYNFASGSTFTIYGIKAA